MVSEPASFTTNRGFQIPVLILVLMEYGLGVNPFSTSDRDFVAS